MRAKLSCRSAIQLGVATLISTLPALIGMMLGGLTAIDAGSPHTVSAGAGAVSRPVPVAPKLHVLRNRPGTAPGMILITPQSLPPAPQDGNEILDGQGRPVWFRPVPPRQFATDLRVQRYRGRPVLTWLQGTLVSK